MDTETLLLIRREVLAADIKARLLARRRTTELDREIRAVTKQLLEIENARTPQIRQGRSTAAFDARPAPDL